MVEANKYPSVWMTMTMMKEMQNDADVDEDAGGGRIQVSRGLTHDSSQANEK